MILLKDTEYRCLGALVEPHSNDDDAVVGVADVLGGERVEHVEVDGGCCRGGRRRTAGGSAPDGSLALPVGVADAFAIPIANALMLNRVQLASVEALVPRGGLSLTKPGLDQRCDGVGMVLPRTPFAVVHSAPNRLGQFGPLSVSKLHGLIFTRRSTIRPNTLPSPRRIMYDNLSSRSYRPP